ncbi:MAG: hypothetical protein WBX15_03540 [Thermoanaerobaculia bacterium]
MRIARSFITAVIVVALAAPAAFAGATVGQHTKFGFGGTIGRMVNLFGGKAAKEGVDSISVVNGDRRNHIVGESGELVDLKEEKIYRINYARKTYTVTTFDELRKQWEDAQKQAEKESGNAEEEKPQEKGPEYTVDVDVKETGKKEVINGFHTHQVIVTTTVREKGKTLEQAGGGVLTSDLWIGPHVSEMKELQSFEQRYASKLYGQMVSGMDMQALARVFASAPQFSEAMKKFQEKEGALDGTPIRTTLTFESVADPRAKKENGEDESAGPSAAAARMIGGFLSRHRGSKNEESEAKSENPNRSMVFTSTNVLTSAEGSADRSKLEIPAGFRQVK